MEYLTKVTPSLKAGDCLIHHTLTVHGSDGNTSDHPRMGWTMQFKGKTSGYDSFMQQRYKRSLDEQINMRK